MPRVNYRGNIYHFPFDAARIADLMSNGYEVLADEGTDEATMQAHWGMLKPELEKLWGNKQFKTAPGTKERKKEDGTPASYDYLKVVPNPLTNYRMPLIDSNGLMGMQLNPQQKNKPTEM